MSWNSVPAVELMVKRGGSVNPSKFPDETFELLSIPAFDKNEPEILKGSEIGSSKSCVEPGDVLLSKIVPHIRRCWVVPKKGEHRQIGSGEWIIFRNDRFDSGFLRHFFTSNVFHSQFMNTVAGVGGSLVRARPAGVELIEIPLPPLAEQKRIAAILDKADAIRRKRQQAIQLADEFLRAVFLDMFGDPVTNPKGFPLGTIRDLVESANYGSSAKASEAVGDYPILRMGNITYEGAIDMTDLKYIDLTDKEKPKYLAVKGDLLFNRTNSKELVGKTAVYDRDDPVAIAGYLIRVRTNEKGNSHYISGYLNSAHGKATLQNMCKSIVGMANINAQEMQDIPLIIPPLSLQNRYRDIVVSTKEKLAAHQAALNANNELFNALSQKAFSGQLS
ncbi:restriction endonuclease subunit S [Marinobacter nauticus]|uniref:Restriction endonuclease subunit S n=1 Tax=Marinobacter nauticus TaxID=2743 RepID=A0A1M2UTT9_MARNT|nr:restriction endonuclease subunit S [Marinobacter nauticus]OJS98783.1 restriction endonuclease subunit S [Marinobacter nauticus]